jgi:hypothetical protein
MANGICGLDHRDPSLTDGFTKDRPVMLFDNVGVAGSSGGTQDTLAGKAAPGLDDLLVLFLSPSQAARRAFWEHRQHCAVDPPSSEQTTTAQIASFIEWRRADGERFAGLKGISRPSLVVNGPSDVTVPTVNALTQQNQISNAPTDQLSGLGSGPGFPIPGSVPAARSPFLRFIEARRSTFPEV